MPAKLTQELSAALHASGEGGLEVIDPTTQQTYFLVDGETHRRAMEALRRRWIEVRATPLGLGGHGTGRAADAVAAVRFMVRKNRTLTRAG